MTYYYSSCRTAVVDARGRLEVGASPAVVPWWSFTKTLVAACALRLAEQGRLALDVPLPGLPYSPRQLLQHRAGLGDYGGLTEYHALVGQGAAPWPDGEIFARLPPERLLFSPGAGWAYSNVGYLILRRLLERTCDAGLGDVLRDLVFAPLGLGATRLAQTPEDMLDTVFPGGRSYHPGWAFPGFAVGPVSEAALALHGLLSGGLLRPASRAAMLDRHPVGGPIAGRPWLATGYGLGLMLGTMQRQGLARPLTVAGHSGGGPGSVAAVYHALDGDAPRTVAAFAAEADEGAAEYEALSRLAPPGR